MSFEEFKILCDTITEEEKKYLRRGQLIMERLYEVWPEEYIRILADPELDCFYVDSRADATMLHLKNTWANFPN